MLNFSSYNYLGYGDLLVITFSKAFGGVGGAVIARQEITQYLNCQAVHVPRALTCGGRIGLLGTA